MLAKIGTQRVIVALIAQLLVVQKSYASHFNDGIYCHSLNGIKSEFAVKYRNSSIIFGISRWFPNGSNASIYGFAFVSTNRNLFVYNAQKPSTNCQISIEFRSKQIIIRQHRSTHCESNFGIGSEIGTIIITEEIKSNKLNNILDNAELFMNDDACF